MYVYWTYIEPVMGKCPWMNSVCLVSDTGSGSSGQLVSIWWAGTFFVECFKCPQECRIRQVMNFISSGVLCWLFGTTWVATPDIRHLFFFFFVTALMEKKRGGGGKETSKLENRKMSLCYLLSSKALSSQDVLMSRSSFIWMSQDAFRISRWF